MSENIEQIYVANPITTNASTDLMYFGQSPYGAGDDAAMTFANFNAQIVANGTANQLGYYATTGNKISPITGANDGVLITSNAGVPSWLANSGTPGYVLTANSGAPPSWQAVSADGAVTTINGDSGSATPSAGVLTISGASTGLTFTGASHTVSLGGTLTGANGGTGHANTGLTINLGSASTGYLLTSDSSGNATWQSPAYLTGAVLLSPSGNQTITTGRLLINNGILVLADPTAGAGAAFTAVSMYSPTGSLGNLGIVSVNNAGNFGNVLQNAATTAARTWTLPDATGTITVLGNTSTGSGSIVLATSPTLVTPTLGAASATSINFGGSTLSTYTSGGTFTPVFNLTTAGDLSVVYTLQNGYYSVIGNIITVVVSMSFTPTYTTASGSAFISGLPFAVGTPPAFGSVSLSPVTFPTGTTYIVCQGVPTLARMYFNANGSVVASAVLSSTSFLTGVGYTISATLTYLI